MKRQISALAIMIYTIFIVILLPQVKAECENTTAVMREVEYLPRGGYGVVVDDGIYLSWRLLGTEPIYQTFDIYRNDEPIVSNLDATNYIDVDGTVQDTYKIVPHGREGLKNDIFKPFSSDYMDILIDKPEGTEEYSYVVRDVSVGDVDNDGEYEFFIKWDPSNYHDNSEDGYTGNVYSVVCKGWYYDTSDNVRNEWRQCNGRRRVGSRSRTAS